MAEKSPLSDDHSSANDQSLHQSQDDIPPTADHNIPLSQDFDSGMEDETVSLQSASRIDRSGPPRKRPSILSIDSPQREAIIAYSARIAELLRLQDLNGGKLPGNELKQAALDLDMKPDWVGRQINHLRKYRAAHGNDDAYTDANAFTPLPIGRVKGRTVSDEVRAIIENAVLNQEWESLNGDGTTSRILQPIGPKIIHTLVKQTIPNPPSGTTVWRVVNDMRVQHPAQFMVARKDSTYLQNILPWIDNKVGGSWERVQFDIRPLPIPVDYNDIVCTVHALILIDDYSDYQPVWHLLPAKRIDTNKDVFRQDYTAQKIRELVAIGILRVGKRMRIQYADNGPQMAYDALHAYMQFLTAPGEDETYLINRRPLWARGGGNVENAGGFVTQFLKYRPGYILEDEYRARLRQNKRIKRRTYEKLSEDFDAFMYRLNHDPGPNGTPSRYAKFQEGRDRSLSLPAPENLAVFALADKKVPRRPSGGRFRLNNKIYVPASRNADLYEEIANCNERAKLDPEFEIILRLFTIAGHEFVFVSLDNEQTWHFLIEKGLDSTTGEGHRRLMRLVEAKMTERGREAAVFMHTLLKGTESPIILNGLRRQAAFEALDEAQQALTIAAESPLHYSMPKDITAEDLSDEPKPAPEEKPSRRRRRETKTPATHKQQPSTPPIVSSNQPPSEQITDEVDDTAEFLRQLNDELGL